ncbi:hypothetical protein [Cypionkella sp.]|uniref:hypothetical protein n=1 Tax=Cypionkella sp. TaxID=2811411 RepID=UPI00261D9D49|nr:hypothetical protein [Cypionkella sp.]
MRYISNLKLRVQAIYCDATYQPNRSGFATDALCFKPATEYLTDTWRRIYNARLQVLMQSHSWRKIKNGLRLNHIFEGGF